MGYRKFLYPVILLYDMIYFFVIESLIYTDIFFMYESFIHMTYLELLSLYLSMI